MSIRDENSVNLNDFFRTCDVSASGISDDHVVVDLFVRHSGVSLYGSGDTLGEAIEDAWRQLEDHLSAVRHLEDLGVDAREIGQLVEGTNVEFGEEPVLAAAGEPIDSTSPGYILALLIPVREARA